MQDKRISLSEAIATITRWLRAWRSEATRCTGGRARRSTRSSASGSERLEIVKTAGAYDIDLLGRDGLRGTAVDRGVRRLRDGTRPCSLATGERSSRARVTVKEHACASVIAGLRAAIQGVPFMPVAGLTGSDVPRVTGFRTLADPYTGQ
ncbi:MAG: hypothetical protein KatS3mg059_1425 [Thermomicrobiales bacterium]|nr:MAG: hypothetical protein KatS3mg059_1425 [Thermomicrobiales bacterium]